MSELSTLNLVVRHLATASGAIQAAQILVPHIPDPAGRPQVTRCENAVEFLVDALESVRAAAAKLEWLL